MNIAFIGFGEAARAFVDSLGSEHAVAAYDRLQTPQMAEAMSSRGVRQAETPEAAVTDAAWIFSAVTADQSLAAAQSVAGVLSSGQVLLDINSVSPDRKRQTAEAVTSGGADYIDMAVMAPVHPRGHATPILIAGKTAAGVVPTLRDMGFDFDVAGEAPGDATAVKMVRSMFVKGLEAITVEVCLAAEASGCFDRVMTSLQKSYPGLDWPDNVAYNLERTLKHGKRRAAEMRESAATFDALGLNGALAAQIAVIQDRMGDLPLNDVPAGPLPEAAAEILGLRRGS